MTGMNRTENVVFRMTPEEKRDLEAKAAAVGMSKSRFLRSLVKSAFKWHGGQASGWVESWSDGVEERFLEAFRD